jgi:hypothetical protein
VIICTIVPVCLSTYHFRWKKCAVSNRKKSTTSLWRWNWHRVPKRRPTTTANWRRGNTQKNIYKEKINLNKCNSPPRLECRYFQRFCFYKMDQQYNVYFHKENAHKFLKNCFGLLFRLWHENWCKAISHFKQLRGQHVARELRVCFHNLFESSVTASAWHNVWDPLNTSQYWFVADGLISRRLQAAEILK